jgi:hypothetical protein
MTGPILLVNVRNTVHMKKADTKVRNNSTRVGNWSQQEDLL